MYMCYIRGGIGHTHLRPQCQDTEDVTMEDDGADWVDISEPDAESSEIIQDGLGDEDTSDEDDSDSGSEDGTGDSDCGPEDGEGHRDEDNDDGYASL
jgi:hypothetical protein